MSKPKTPKDYENLGRTVAVIYESGYLDKRLALKMSFLKGVMTGLGGVVGATVLVALLLWVLSWFNEVPLIGHFVDNVRSAVDN